MEGGGDNNGGLVNSNMRGLKLPPFNPDKDDLDSYLTGFERACQAFDVDPRHWSTQLARLLQMSISACLIEMLRIMKFSKRTY